MTRPIVLIHGYSSEAKAFGRWKQALEANAANPVNCHLIEYVSLSNELTIRDVAEGFDRALRRQAGLAHDDDFDAVVHSTGMLVIRSWLATYPKRRSRLRHLIGLAPATFGSPLAHKGQSWLGAVFKGNKKIGPDFLEAGRGILDGLELASVFTWDLAHRDLFGSTPFYGSGNDTPFVYIFCGNRGYGDILRKSFAKEPGTDGTVRWAGCSLNSRKVTMDLTHNAEPDKRIRVGAWHDVSRSPVLFCSGKHHGSIMDPSADMIHAVLRALEVETEEQHAAWCAEWEPQFAGATPHPWQQFVVRVRDERDDPVSDFNITLRGTPKTENGRGAGTILKAFELDVHPYSRDKSYRAFHVDLGKLLGWHQLNGVKTLRSAAEAFDSLQLELTAASGTAMVGYCGVSSEGLVPDSSVGEIRVDLSGLLDQAGEKTFRFFYPFTTTLLDIRLDREPLPLEEVNKVCWFVG